MIYFEDCFYLSSGKPYDYSYITTFKYCLEDKIWINITNPNEIIETKSHSSGFEYNGFYYLFQGDFYKSKNPIRMKLGTGSFLWSEVKINPSFRRHSFGYYWYKMGPICLEGSVIQVFNIKMICSI